MGRVVGHQQVEIPVHRDADRVPELVCPIPHAAEGPEPLAVGGELLDAAVQEVGRIDVAQPVGRGPEQATQNGLAADLAIVEGDPVGADDGPPPVLAPHRGDAGALERPTLVGLLQVEQHPARRRGVAQAIGRIGGRVGDPAHRIEVDRERLAHQRSDSVELGGRHPGRLGEGTGRGIEAAQEGAAVTRAQIPDGGKGGGPRAQHDARAAPALTRKRSPPAPVPGDQGAEAQGGAIARGPEALEGVEGVDGVGHGREGHEGVEGKGARGVGQAGGNQLVRGVQEGDGGIGHQVGSARLDGVGSHDPALQGLGGVRLAGVGRRDEGPDG
ncbi:hypothetical protein D3C87_1238730 [compost metagenome]